LYRDACSRGLQAGERVRSSQVSRCVNVKSLLVVSQMAYGFAFSLCPSRMVSAFPFYRCKGDIGLHVCVTRRLSREGRAEVSNPARGVPLLEEWLLSFYVVATCHDIRGPRDDATKARRVVIILVVTCLSLRFDWRRESRPQRRESWRDFALLEGIVP
jgi:hypothetical protein